MNVFKKAHEMTKKIIKKGDDYRATFALALKFVYTTIQKGVNKMVELVGTEKQVKWANDIREVVIKAAQKNLEFEKTRMAGKEGKKLYIRFVGGAENLLNKLSNETQAKYFIDKFSHVLSENSKRHYKIESEVYKVDYYSCVADDIFWETRLNRYDAHQ